MEADESGTLAQLKSLREDIFDVGLAKHNGRVVKTMGDGMLAEFASAVDAVQHAVNVQNALAEENKGEDPGRGLQLLIGINVGDVIVKCDDLYGDGVNIAARLEAMADPGAIFVSGTVFDQIGKKLDLAFDNLGPIEVKTSPIPYGPTE